MRKTKIRTDLLKTLEIEERPRSAFEILNFLSQKHPTINKTTVYRELNFLVANKIVGEIYWNDGIVRYEKENKSCHHHLVCESCGDVSDVFIKEKNIINSIAKLHNFKINKHSIEFFGLCSNCR